MLAFLSLGNTWECVFSLKVTDSGFHNVDIIKEGVTFSAVYWILLDCNAIPFQEKIMAWHPQATVVPCKKRPLLFPHPRPSPVTLLPVKSFITTTRLLSGYSRRRETRHTIRWCLRRVIFLRPRLRNLTLPPFCCTRAQTAVKILACGMCRRWRASCILSAARITRMPLLKRYVKLAVISVLAVLPLSLRRRAESVYASCNARYTVQRKLCRTNSFQGMLYLKIDSCPTYIGKLEWLSRESITLWCTAKSMN